MIRICTIAALVLCGCAQDDVTFRLITSDGVMEITAKRSIGAGGKVQGVTRDATALVESGDLRAFLTTSSALQHAATPEVPVRDLSALIRMLSAPMPIP